MYEAKHSGKTMSTKAFDRLIVTSHTIVPIIALSVI